MNIERDSTNAMVNLGVDGTRELLKLGIGAIKLTGQAAKDGLLKILEASRTKKENASGEIALKRLLNSNEEIQLVRINKEHLDLLREKAKEYGIGFGCISVKGAEQAKVIFKASKANLMKEVLKDILEIEKFNNKEKASKKVDKTKEDIFDKKLDFDYIDEQKYRRAVKQTDVDKLEEIRRRNDIDIKQMEILMDDTGVFYFKCDMEDKEKLDRVIDDMDKKSIDEILKDATEKANSSANKEREESKDKSRTKVQERDDR